MADINLSGKRGKSLPRVDLTPMVDLGFILITFFIYTTTLLEQKTMDMNLPVPSNSNQEIPLESTLTLIPTAKHQIAWYSGVAKNKTDIGFVPIATVRNLILQKQYDTKNLPATFSQLAHKLHVVIKPDRNSKYSDLITVLDEMVINAVPYYVLQDLSVEEQRWLTP